MSEVAQIILAVGVALGIVLFALQGNLSLVLGRSRLKAGIPPGSGSIRRERWLLAIVCVSAVSGFFNLLRSIL